MMEGLQHAWIKGFCNTLKYFSLIAGSKPYLAKRKPQILGVCQGLASRLNLPAKYKFSLFKDSV
jgi:hypothetical protein